MTEKMGFENKPVHFDWHNKRPIAYGYQFKSKAEKRWADYLYLLQISREIRGWSYEPETFNFKERRRHKGRYTPDFKVQLNGGEHEWHEVKTSLRQKDIYRFKQFHWDFPDERITLVLTSQPTKNVTQKIRLDNALKYVNNVIFAGPILRKLGL